MILIKHAAGPVDLSPFQRVEMVPCKKPLYKNKTNSTSFMNLIINKSMKLK